MTEDLSGKRFGKLVAIQKQIPQRGKSPGHGGRDGEPRQSFTEIFWNGIVKNILKNGKK